MVPGGPGLTCGLTIYFKNRNSPVIACFIKLFLQTLVVRVWWKGLPAVHREKGSGRRRPAADWGFLLVDVNHCLFHCLFLLVDVDPCLFQLVEVDLPFLVVDFNHPAFFNLPFSSGRLQPSCLFLGVDVDLPFSTCLFLMVDVLVDSPRCRRPFYSPFHNAP